MTEKNKEPSRTHRLPRTLPGRRAQRTGTRPMAGPGRGASVLPHGHLPSGGAAGAWAGCGGGVASGDLNGDGDFNVSTTGVTDEEGFYSFTNLPLADYRLTILESANDPIEFNIGEGNDFDDRVPGFFECSRDLVGHAVVVVQVETTTVEFIRT